MAGVRAPHAGLGKSGALLVFRGFLSKNRFFKPCARGQLVLYWKKKEKRAGQGPRTEFHRMKIAIFGGSFDPVHAEHVRIARAAREKLGADKIIVVPAGLPPHKQERHLAPAAARLEMARLAFSGIPGCEVSPYEINAGGTSYTVRTVHRFRERYPQDELYLLVGADMLRDFYSWKQPEEILSMAQLVACGREGDPADFQKEQKRFSARFGKPFIPLGYTGAAVSSTEVRALCAFGEDVRSLVPAEVADYIDANELYRVGPVRRALEYLTPARRKHSLRVALMAAERSASAGVSEYAAVLAAGLHDCAKNLPADSPLLKGFAPPEEVPAPVLHQYSGAYVAECILGVTDADVLDAIRYHTSGKPEMTALGKLIFLSDMLEAGRDFPGIRKLRRLFAENLNACMYHCLKQELKHLKKGGGNIYPLTFRAYEYYKEHRK